MRTALLCCLSSTHAALLLPPAAQPVLRPRVRLAMQAGAPEELEPACTEQSCRPPSFLELLKFTVTAMPIYVSPTLLSLIDTATVGQVSSVQLAAMGPACAICDATTSLCTFISVGTTNAVSSAVGAGDADAAKRAATVSVLASAAIGGVIALVLFFGIGPIVARFAAPAAVASTLSRTGGDAAAAAATRTLWASCVRYVRIRALSFPAALVLMSAQAACLGAKDSKAPTIATLVASTVNVVGDVILVLGPLSMGIAGAAWATVGCQLAAAALLVRPTGWLAPPELARLAPTRQLTRRRLRRSCARCAPRAWSTARRSAARRAAQSCGASSPSAPSSSCCSPSSSATTRRALRRSCPVGCSPRSLRVRRPLLPPAAPRSCRSAPRTRTRTLLLLIHPGPIALPPLVTQGVVLATILGTAAGAAHQCLYSLFRLCCTLGGTPLWSSPT